jgi:predicted  nucleic acid-binding Zn-ribbon protein
METREEADARLTAAQTRLDEATAALTDAEKRRDAAFADVDQTIADRTAERGPLAASLPADLLGLYEKIRSAHGGIGAAMLRARRCEGCRLDLSGSDLSAARSAADDEVLRCDECRRILVRTKESGL